MKFLTFLLSLSLLFAVASCNKKKEGAETPATPGAPAAADSKDAAADEGKVLYSMGAMHGENLSRFEFTDKQMEDFLRGFKDALGGKKLEVNVADFQPKIREFYTKQMKDVAERNKKRGVDFLEKFVKEEGGQKTASGLAYKVITEGTGKNPTENDEIEVHYKGTLIDGTQFDSSYDRNEKIKFPLNRVILGWKEGLQLVKEGGKIKLVVPAELGYGEFGAPPKIPGGATLVFEVELFKIMDKQAPKSEIAPAADKEEVKADKAEDKKEIKAEPKKAKK